MFKTKISWHYLGLGMFILSVIFFEEKECRLFWETKLMAKDTIETAHSNKGKWWLNNAEKYREMKAKIMHKEHLHNAIVRARLWTWETKMKWLKDKLNLIQSKRYRYRKNCCLPPPILVSVLVPHKVGGIAGKIV